MLLVKFLYRQVYFFSYQVEALQMRKNSRLLYLTFNAFWTILFAIRLYKLDFEYILTINDLLNYSQYVIGRTI